MNGETGFLHSFRSGRWLSVGLLKVRGELAIEGASSCHRLVYGTRLRGSRLQQLPIRVNLRVSQFVDVVRHRCLQYARYRFSDILHLGRLEPCLASAEQRKDAEPAQHRQERREEGIVWPDDSRTDQRRRGKRS